MGLDKKTSAGKAVFVLLFVSFACGSAKSLLAQDFNANGTLRAEATIFDDEPDFNGGGYSNFCIGNQSNAGTTRRGLVRYDLPEIPGDATITRVTLGFRQLRVRDMGVGGPSNATFQARRLDSAWVEGRGGANNAACGGGTASGGVTWNNAPDAVVALSGSTPLPSTNGFDFLLDSDVGSGNNGLIDDVLAWLANPSSNNGWLIQLNEESNTDNARLIATGTLTVYWTVPQEPTQDINAGMNDAWFNAATSGQGFFFTVFPDLELFFLAWFTYDLELPDESLEAIFGDAGHRWVTAIGTWEGNKVTLDVELTEGGILDAAVPMPTQTPGYGTILIEFHDCNSATLTYDFPGLDISGTIELTRAAEDNVALCEALSES